MILLLLILTVAFIALLYGAIVVFSARYAAYEALVEPLFWLTTACYLWQLLAGRGRR